MISVVRCHQPDVYLLPPHTLAHIHKREKNNRRDEEAWKKRFGTECWRETGGERKEEPGPSRSPAFNFPYRGDDHCRGRAAGYIN